MPAFQQGPAFSLSLSLPRPTESRRSQCTRTPPFAKKGGSGKKRSKSSRPKRTTPPSTSTSKSTPTSFQPDTFASPGVSPPQYPGPLAPELLADGNTIRADDDTNSVETDIQDPAEISLSPGDDSIPLPDEGKLKLPDIRTSSTSGKAVRRKRKPRAKDIVQPERSIEVDKRTKQSLPSEKIRELTKAYRTGGEAADKLINEIEKDPDFMFQTGNPDGEYDLASAIIGTGSPNKQGVYVLPYLQSGHLLLLLVVLLCTFVYYPGFPLTELDDSVRLALKAGLGITYSLNAVLAVLAYRDAKKRGQPAAFWSLKTAFLGNIAFNELRRNAPMASEGKSKG